MKGLGLELRNAGLHLIYSDVDLVLGSFGMSEGETSQEAQVSTLAHALQKMINTDSRFSVCTVRDCAEMCCIRIPHQRMQIYSAAHCMSWEEMLPDYRKMITAMVLDDFRYVLNPEPKRSHSKDIYSI